MRCHALTKHSSARAISDKNTNHTGISTLACAAVWPDRPTVLWGALQARALWASRPWLTVQRDQGLTSVVALKLSRAMFALSGFWRPRCPGDISVLKRLPTCHRGMGLRRSQYNMSRSKSGQWGIAIWSKFAEVNQKNQNRGLLGPFRQRRRPEAQPGSFNPRRRLPRGQGSMQEPQRVHSRSSTASLPR